MSKRVDRGKSNLVDEDQSDPDPKRGKRSTFSASSSSRVEGDLPTDPNYQMVHEEVARISGDWSSSHDSSVSLLAIGFLSEVLMGGLEVLSKDMEAFAAHAGRKTITPDDVFLSARKTPDLRQFLIQYRDTHFPNKGRNQRK